MGQPGRQKACHTKVCLLYTSLAEGIPPAFRSPFIKDVSESYFDGIDLAMKLTIPIAAKKKFAYLVVFDNRNCCLLYTSPVIF